MAKLIACAVFDAAVGAYNRPFFVPSQGLAIRSFIDEVSREAGDNPMRQHPQDFALWRLGSFDESSGLLVGEQPERLASATDFALTE